MGRKVSGRKKFQNRRGVVVTGRHSKQMANDIRGIERQIRKMQSRDRGER